MSVDFARRYMTEMRAYGVTIIEHPGWDRRGNGQTSAYLGGIIHHTGSGFNAGLSVLLDGRRDLPPPLCNVAGHTNGDMRLIAAHPANHAGAGAGKSMGPLPRTNLFNRLVWGLEIMYPGAQPMTREQMRSALIHAGVVSKILGRPNPEWIRAHAETSSTGKWDPGFAPGRTIDMAQFRRDVTPTLLAARPPSPPPEVDVPLTNDEIARIAAASAAATLDAQIARGGSTQKGSGPTTPRSVIGYWDHAQVLDRQETETVGSKVDALDAKVDAILNYLAPKES